MALSVNAKAIIRFLQTNDGDFTAADVAEALDLPKKTIDGCFTSLQKKELGVRTPEEITLEDGSTKTIKFLSLTPAGMDIDVDAPDAE